MRLADPVVDRKGNKLMSARSIYEIPDSKLAAFGDPKKIRDEVATQFQTHILDEQGMAVIEAGLRERTWLTAGTKKGTAMGEIWRSMTQFKSFPAAFLMRHGSRTMAQDGLKGKSTAFSPQVLQCVFAQKVLTVISLSLQVFLWFEGFLHHHFE